MADKIQCNRCSKLFENAAALKSHQATAHPPMVSDDQLDQAARRAVWEYLTSDGQDLGLRERAKQANAYRSTEARREQTQGAREATVVMMARELAQNKDQFQEYIRLAMPSSPMLQAAPTGKA